MFFKVVTTQITKLGCENEQPQLTSAPSQLPFPLPTEWTRPVALKHDVASQPDIPLDYHSIQPAHQPVNQSVNQLDSKDKAVPLQAWSGPEGSRKLRFPYFMTTAQEGGKIVSLTHRPHLSPGNSPGTHFC